MSKFVTVLPEIRRVARILEAYKRVTGSRLPRSLKQLYVTLDLFTSDRSHRREKLEEMGQSLVISCSDESQLMEARKRILQDPTARELAKSLRGAVYNRTGHLFMPVNRKDVLYILRGEAVEEIGSIRCRKPNQAVLFHCSAFFDVNESDFSWIPENIDRVQYVRLLCDVV